MTSSNKARRYLQHHKQHYTESHNIHQSAAELLIIDPTLAITSMRKFRGRIQQQQQQQQQSSTTVSIPQICVDNDDDDNNNNNNNHQHLNHIQDEHFTQRENNLNTLRQNFKCVQHPSTSI
jgi:hypothetical protein